MFTGRNAEGGNINESYTKFYKEEQQARSQDFSCVCVCVGGWGWVGGVRFENEDTNL